MKFIKEGIRKENNRYVFDYETDIPNDIVNLTGVKIYKSSLQGSIYYFGYEFTKNSSRKERSDFINYIKGLSDEVISKEELDRFISKPLVEFNKEINLNDIDLVIYPRSERSELVQNIIEVFNRVAPHNLKNISYEAIKNNPEDIEFDYDRFAEEFRGDDHTMIQILDYVENELMPKIHSLEYFSIARDVKTKYRKYIVNYLNIDNAVVNKLNDNSNVIIIDDINSSRSTLEELIRGVRKLNNKCNVFIFTLIGKTLD